MKKFELLNSIKESVPHDFAERFFLKCLFFTISGKIIKLKNRHLLQNPSYGSQP